MKVAHLSEPAEERVVFRDGLGVRERRETTAGEVVEWFHLDPAFAGVEQPLRERVLRLAKLQHVKFARIFSLEPATRGRGPILVSSHVAGTRLAEILEMAGHGLLTFDPGAGLQVTREVLGGLTVLHDSRNVAHGALGPERVILTATGRVVMVEHVLAHALDRLQRPRHQLWRDWRIPTPPAAGPVRLDMQTDLAQAGLLALAVLLGRPIDESEYPHRLRGLLPLAQDRLSRSPAAGIAGDVIAWLERLAPVDSRRAFKTVREAQHAFEALVSGSALAMGVTPARVKDAVAAVTAMTPAPAPALDVPPAPAVAAAPVVVALPVATPAEPDPVAAEAEIDIEALLRLEAELEGGTSPADTAIPFEPPCGPLVEDPSTPIVAAGGSESSLEALAQERLDLERQFAELVATVAPQEEAPVHLIPEVPATSEPLVAARVLWSSMPADDLAESIETLPEALPPPGFATEPLCLPSEPVEWNTFAPAPVDPDADLQEPATADAPALVEPAGSASPVPEDAPGVFVTSTAPMLEPILVFGLEEVRPAAASASVPDGWWTEALPWRTENRVAADQDIATSVENTWSEAEVDTAEVSGLAIDVDEGEWAAAVAFEPGVGDDFGDVSLETVGPGLDASVTAADIIHGDEASLPAGEYRLFADIAPVVGHEDAEPEPVEAEAPVGLHWADDAPMLAGFDDVPVEPAAEVVVQDDVSLTAAATAPLLETWDEEQGVTGVASDDATESADGTSGGDDAATPAGEYRLFADIAPVDSHEEAEAEPAEADAPVGLHWADDAPVLEGFDDVPVEPVATAPLLETWDEQGVTGAAAVDATESADGTPGRDDTAAPAGEDRLCSDIASIVLEDVAVDAELAEADAPLALHHADEAPVLAELDETLAEPVVEVVAKDEAALTAYTAEARLEAQDEQDVTGAAAVDATGVADEKPRGDEAVAPTGEYRLFADIAPPALQEDADVDVPTADALFGSHHVDSAPVTAATSLLSREVTEHTTPDWRHAFLESTPVEAPVAEETGTSSGTESTAPPWPEPPLALEALELSIEPASHAADDPAVEDAFAPELAAESEPLPQLRPEEPAQPDPAADGPDIVPTLVIVDDGPDRDAWDDLPSEALALPAMTASVARKKKKRSRRKKGMQAGALDLPPALTAELAPATVVAAPPTPAVRTTEDGGQSAVTVSASSLLAREVPTWTPPADLGIRRTPAAAMAVDADAQPDESRGTGERVPNPTMPVAVPPPLSVASTVEVVRPVTATSLSPVLRASEASGAFEQEIRAVGMPDLEDLAPRQARPALTSMADGIGSASGSGARVVPFEPRVAVAAPDVARGVNWRRFVAASVLIALFQGAAFAAWWWVQPGVRGTLVVQTSKVGVEVLLDDKVVGRTPFRGEVAPGRHRLGLRQGSTVREMPVEISVGVVTTQAIHWPSLTGGRGNLQVTSNPTGAKIFVNGKARGEAPLLLEDLPAGDQVLTVRSDAGSVTVTAMVVADETTPLEVKIFAGWVLVDAPVEVNLLLNGREKIGSSMDGQILLPPGTHRVQAVNEGLGIRQWFTVTVEPGAVRRVPLRVASGTLALQEEAEVFVDGTSAGTTPGTISIAPGTHDIAIRPVSGPERRQAMTVRSGQRIEF